MSMTMREFQVFEALSFAFLQPPDIPVHKKSVTLNKGHALIALVHEMRHASFQTCLFHKEAIQEGHDLATGASFVGTEGGVTGTAGDAVGHRPHNSFAVVVLRVHIGKGIL